MEHDSGWLTAWLPRSGVPGIQMCSHALPPSSPSCQHAGGSSAGSQDTGIPSRACRPPFHRKGNRGGAGHVVVVQHSRGPCSTEVDETQSSIMDTQSDVALNQEQRALVDDLLTLYDDQLSKLKATMMTLVQELVDDEGLARHIHSIRCRLKSRQHLQEKLERRVRQGDTDLHRENFFQHINDLIGIRVLHIHSRQIKDIDRSLRAWIEANRHKLLEGPIARAWDDERRKFFREMTIATIENRSLYTSVHYVAQVDTQTGYTFEIQVRTLLEEVWGEVDHSMNYPKKSDSVLCQELLQALAKLTSRCDRLVDSIFATNEI
jgi:putative GTP pyrophosphokinase